jgi:Tol biopolymer transport system component
MSRPRAAIISSLVALALPIASSASEDADSGLLAISVGTSIQTVDPQSGKVTRVKRVGGSVRLAWSPDRRTLAYAPVGTGIWLLRLDDGSTRQLTEGDSDDEPAWSPDGSRIAFSGRDLDRCELLQLRTCVSEIFVVNADGTGLRRLTDGRDAGNGHRSPTWSPDGRRIAFSAVEPWGNPRHTEKSRIMIVPAKGGRPRTVLELPVNFHPDYLDWSPRTNRIVFASVHGSGHPSRIDLAATIATVNPDGTGLRELTKPSLGRADNPAWSPDGTQIAFIVRKNYTKYVHVIPATGGTARKLVGAAYVDW